MPLYKILFFLIVFILSSDLIKSNNILRFSNYNVDNGLSQNTITGIIKDKYGFIWIGTWEGLCRYDGYKFTVYRAEIEDSNAITNNRINNVFKDTNDIVWVVTSDQTFCRYNYDNDNFSRFSYDKVPSYFYNEILPKIRNNRLRAENPDYIWEYKSNEKEFIQTSKKTGKQVSYKDSPNNFISVNYENITFLYYDNQDILWIGTENNGIFKADTRIKPFINYEKLQNTNNSLIDNLVRAIAEDNNGNIWVGTLNKGVTKIDTKNKRYIHLQHNDRISNSLIDNRIRSIYCDEFGYIWIGTKNGLDKYNKQNNSFEHFTNRTNNNIINNSVFCITEDHNHNLWIGTSNAISKYDRKRNCFIAFNPDSLLTRRNVRVIYEDTKHNLWIGTEGNGLIVLKRDTLAASEKLIVLKHYLYKKGNENSLINNTVLTIVEDEHGMIWIGTNNGLCKLDIKKEIFYKFNVKSGFPDDLIMGILDDNKGNIWISHKKGITRMNVTDYSIRTFTRSDGLPCNEFLQNAYYKSNVSGKMYFGGVNGFTVFNPDSIFDNPHYPFIVFTSLRIFNKPVDVGQKINGKIVLEKSLLETKEIFLSYNFKNITIEFAGLHYSNPSENKYEYMLEGFDKNWISTYGNENFANYANLEPKKYIFKVKSANCDGVWNPIPKCLIIHVLPPWWRTWWAYAIYILIIIALLYFFYNYIISKIEYRNQLALERMKAEKMHEIDQMKIDFFTNVSHELRTPLSLILDPLEKLHSDQVDSSKLKNYYAIMYRNAKRLLLNINQLLDFRKIEAGKLNLELSKNDIIAFVNNIVEMFSLQANKRNIILRLNAFTQSYMMYFDKDKLDKILFNLISNAFKYTPDNGEICVDIEKEKTNDEKIDNEFLKIYIKDTGIGIADDEKDKIFDIFYQAKGQKVYNGDSSGLGLALTKKLIELHKGEIFVESELGKGSCFILKLPVLYNENVLYENNEEFYEHKQNMIIDENIVDKSRHELENTDNINEKSVLLIVEDNEDVRNYLKDELNENFFIVESDNGLDGYNVAVENMPDLIISDIMMPGIDGIELCKKLKNNEITSHIPIILLTARHSMESKIAGYETGADAYVTKPFSSALLKIQVKSIIESRKKLRQLFSKNVFIDPKIISSNITDEKFLNKIIEIVKENIMNIDTELLAEKLKVSKRQLYRKIQSLTGQTVHDFVSNIRLNMAIELLLQGELNISEISYKLGYTELSNFTRSFKNKTGKSPKTFVKDMLNKK